MTKIKNCESYDFYLVYCTVLATKTLTTFAIKNTKRNKKMFL